MQIGPGNQKTHCPVCHCWCIPGIDGLWCREGETEIKTALWCDGTTVLGLVLNRSNLWFLISVHCSLFEEISDLRSETRDMVLEILSVIRYLISDSW